MPLPLQPVMPAISGMKNPDPITLTPIGHFVGPAHYPYDCPRQAVFDDRLGKIELQPGHDYEQALPELEGMERIWVIYLFDRNRHWKPRIQPPDQPDKVGVFATRAPYRPNPIGMSAVELVSIDGLTLTVRGTDLMDQTPILDIKPYLPYCDAFPESATGWHALPDPYSLHQEPAFTAAAEWLLTNHCIDLVAFAKNQLQFKPDATNHKRITPDTASKHFTIAYRTWRISYVIDEIKCRVTLLNVHSGYLPDDLAEVNHDPHADKSIHQQFIANFHRVEKGP